MPQEDEAKLYVGNIPEDATKEDIYDLFETYGRVLYVDIKNGKISRFAFVAYRDFRDADDAVNYLDKFDYHGRSLRVEHSTGVGPRGWGGQPLSSINGDNFRIGRGPGGPQRRSDFRVFVEGIPQTGSWQDLKDHLRPAGEICFAMVSHNKTGIVEFEKKSSVQRSIDMFDKTEFTSHHDETKIIRVTDYSSIDIEKASCSCYRSRSKSRSPSRSPSRSRSRSRTPSYKRCPSRSPSRSHSPHFPTRMSSRSPSCSPLSKRWSSYESRQRHCKSSRRNGRTFSTRSS
ncbi:unnamed protein product [Caenorhabditis brenneri]